MQEPLPGSVTIKCIDGEVVEHPYVLMRCFPYFITYYNTPMNVAENPTVEFSTKAVGALLWFLFHKNLGCVSTDTLTFSDVVEIYRCAEFLCVDNELHEILFWLVTTAKGDYDEDITDLIIQHISMYTPSAQGTLINIISPASVVKMSQNSTVKKYLKNIYNIDSKKAYEIWKVCGRKFTIKMNGIMNICEHFTVEDYIACYETLETIVRDADGFRFRTTVKILKKCNHLGHKSEIKKYWTFLNYISD